MKSEELYQFLKERYVILLSKMPSGKEPIEKEDYLILGRIKELDYILQLLEKVEDEKL